MRHTRWEPAAGARQDEYDDVLVCASKGLPEELADDLKTFDTGKLVPYSPGYIAGWRAEEYAIDLDRGFELAQAKMAAENKAEALSVVEPALLAPASVPANRHLSFGHTNQRGHTESGERDLCGPGPGCSAPGDPRGSGTSR